MAEDDPKIEAPTFPPIGEDSPPESEPGSEPGSDQGETTEDRLARIEEQLASERESFREREQRQQDTIDRLMQGIQPQSTDQPQDRGGGGGSGDDVLADLPDPVEKPDEFKKSLGEKINGIHSEFRQSTAERDAQSRRERAWQNFQSRYSDLSDYPAEVNYAVNQEARRLQSRGASLDQALESDDGLFERIAESTRDYLKNKGIEPGEQAAGEDGGSGDKGSKPNRTAGVSAGSKGSGGSEKKPPQTKSFVKSLLEDQQANGLI